MSEFRIVLFFWNPAQETGTSLAAFLKRTWPSYRVLSCNLARQYAGWLRHAYFDVAMLHSSLLDRQQPDTLSRCLGPLTWLRRHPSRKVALVLDDTLAAFTLDEWLYHLNVTEVYTCATSQHIPLLYPLLSQHARFRSAWPLLLAQLTAETESVSAPLSQRSIELLCPFFDPPYWLGQQGQSLWQLANRVYQYAQERGWRCQRCSLEGDDWLGKLARARAVLLPPCGSAVLDGRGQWRARIQWWLKQQPGLSFEEIYRRLPSGWDDYHFWYLGQSHLAALKAHTSLILIEGEYETYPLCAGQHFLLLRRDLSNLDTILDQLRNLPLLEKLVCQAGAVALSPALQVDMSPRVLVPTTPYAKHCIIPFPLACAYQYIYEKYQKSRLMRGARRVCRGLRFLASVRTQVLFWHLFLVCLGRGLSRRLVLHWLRTPIWRQQISLPRLVKDLLLLRAACRLAVRRRSWSLLWDQEHGRLLLTAAPPPADSQPLSGHQLLARIEQGQVRRFVWNHQSVGESIRFRCGGVARWYYIGTEKEYSFPALASLWQQEPIWLALWLRSLLLEGVSCAVVPSVVEKLSA